MGGLARSRGDHHTNSICPPSLFYRAICEAHIHHDCKRRDPEHGEDLFVGCIDRPQSQRDNPCYPSCILHSMGRAKGKGALGKGRPHRCSTHSFPPRLTLLFFFPAKIVVWWSASNCDKISLCHKCVRMFVCVRVSTKYFSARSLM